MKEKMKKRFEPYNDLISEKPNPLDYLSDIVSLILSEIHCKFLTHAEEFVREKNCKGIVLLDVGGDLGIHGYILGAIANTKINIIDIRERVQDMDCDLLHKTFGSIIQEGIGSYEHSWMSNVSIEEFKKNVQTVSTKVLENVKGKAQNNVVNYVGKNFYSWSKNTDLIMSFSSLDYFSANEFFSKCSSLQQNNPGALIYAWIPSLVFHFNPAEVVFNDTLSAPATLSLERIITKGFLRFKNVGKIIQKLFWYQNGDGPMVLENYCEILLSHDYEIIYAKRPSVAKYSEKSKTYTLNWYGKKMRFTKNKVVKALNKAKKNSPTISKYLVAEDFFAPYYYILARKIK